MNSAQTVQQLSFDENLLLFDTVQRFILDTCRFS